MAGWVRGHWLFAMAFLVGLVARVVTMLGFPPAIWFGGDSASYLSTALRLAPGTSRLSGYGVMLRVLEPFHSFAVVTAVQHVMGLAMAAMSYALLRRYGLPGWGATLAALPVLLSAYQLELEQEILPSAAFGFFVLLAVTLALWWRQDRPRWAMPAAGLLLAGSATFWPAGLPLVVLFLAYLAVRRAGWRTVTATAAAAAVPLAGYLLWFGAVYGRVAFTYSDGIYLWSRTMSFANCAVIKPPAPERGLCPRQPVAARPAASSFIWARDSPLNRVPGKKFSPGKNALAQDFALRAIAAQPGGYAAAVLHDFWLSFRWNIPPHPSALMTRRYEFAYATTPWISPGYVLVPGHTVASDRLAYGGKGTATRAVAPFAGWLRGYQRFAYLRGTLLGAVLLTGLAGIARAARTGDAGIARAAQTGGAWKTGEVGKAGVPGVAWGAGVARMVKEAGDAGEVEEAGKAGESGKAGEDVGGVGWGGPGVLPWLASVALLLVPVMTADYSERYALIAVPTACLAGGLAFVPRRRAHAPGPVAADARTAASASP